MKKLFVLIAVLVLFAGTAFAGNLNDLQTAELAADTHGRSVISDSSVILKVWYTGTAISGDGGAAGVSSNTILKLYSLSQTGTATSVDTSTYTTVGAVVDYINSVTDFKASIGPDGYRDMSSAYLLSDDITLTPGVNAPKSIYLDCSSAGFITCGVAPTDNNVNRIKSITHRIAGTGPVTVRVYDNNTAVYRKDIAADTYVNASTLALNGASPDTVNFAELTAGKGISSGRGNGLVLRVDRTTINATDSTAKAGEETLSITYDQIVK